MASSILCKTIIQMCNATILNLGVEVQYQYPSLPFFEFQTLS